MVWWSSHPYTFHQRLPGNHPDASPLPWCWVCQSPWHVRAVHWCNAELEFSWPMDNYDIGVKVYVLWVIDRERVWKRVTVCYQIYLFDWYTLEFADTMSAVPIHPSMGKSPLFGAFIRWAFVSICRVVMRLFRYWEVDKVWKATI